MLYLHRYYWMRKKEALIRFLQNGSLGIVGGDGVMNDEAARSAGVPVILDAGGMDAPVPIELLRHVDILSPNESELARLTRMPTETFEQISLDVAECHKLGVKEVLVKFGGRGSVLFSEGKEPIKQGIIAAEKCLIQRFHNKVHSCR
ncbi:putative carbohydrate kinase PfkB, ribokinase [Helianthus anomalus]